MVLVCMCVMCICGWFTEPSIGSWMTSLSGYVHRSQWPQKIYSHLVHALPTLRSPIRMHACICLYHFSKFTYMAHGYMLWVGVAYLLSTHYTWKPDHCLFILRAWANETSHFDKSHSRTQTYYTLVCDRCSSFFHSHISSATNSNDYYYFVFFFIQYFSFSLTRPTEHCTQEQYIRHDAFYCLVCWLIIGLSLLILKLIIFKFSVFNCCWTNKKIKNSLLVWVFEIMRHALAHACEHSHWTNKTRPFNVTPKWLLKLLLIV